MREHGPEYHIVVSLAQAGLTPMQIAFVTGKKPSAISSKLTYARNEGLEVPVGSSGKPKSNTSVVDLETVRRIVQSLTAGHGNTGN